MDKILDPSICGWDTAHFLLFSDNVFGNFIYYSHLFPAFTAFLLGLYVFIQNPRGRANRALLFLSVVFACWSLIDLVLWATERTDYTMFFWSILIHFDLLLYVGALYFIYAFVDGRFPGVRTDLTVLVLFLPLVFFGHTEWNLVGFDFTNCWREALEGPLWQYYVYTAELAIAAWILAYGAQRASKATHPVERRKIMLATGGLLLFLISFSLGNIAGSIEVDWELGQYGLFGMPIFAAFLTYLTVKYHTFEVKVLGTEAIVVGLAILVLSLLFVRTIENVQTIALITFGLVIILGAILTRSVQREIEQRKQIEKLAKQLTEANVRLKELDKMKSEFVSIASHQLRSPLTAIRGYTSMLLEGSFGKVPQKATEAIQRISESSRYMALSVEDYLNVSRIEAGNMKYELTEFNLREETEKVVDELRPTALKKGLVLTFKSACAGQGTVKADIGKTRQVILNLIDNAVKYTKKGTVEVFVHNDLKRKKMIVSITDSGVGMSTDAIESLFEKFVRAKNANSVNVTGTGLGLYVAKRMVEEMGGRIWAESPGEGKGSTFHIELALVG